MTLRFLKYLFIAVFAVVAAILLWAIVSFWFSSSLDAEVVLPDSDTQIVLELTPSHPFLAEYKRTLVLRKNGFPDQRVGMVADTGGYSRTQLYRLPDGHFFVRSFFEVIKIDPMKHRLIVLPEKQVVDGTYLGAFDDTSERKWQFISADKSPKQTLIAELGG